MMILPPHLPMMMRIPLPMIPRRREVGMDQKVIRAIGIRGRKSVLVVVVLKKSTKKQTIRSKRTKITLIITVGCFDSSKR